MPKCSSGNDYINDDRKFSGIGQSKGLVHKLKQLIHEDKDKEKKTLKLQCIQMSEGLDKHTTEMIDRNVLKGAGMPTKEVKVLPNKRVCWAKPKTPLITISDILAIVHLNQTSDANVKRRTDFMSMFQLL